MRLANCYVGLLVGFLLVLNSCGDGVEPTLPPPPASNNKMSCDINGKFWEADTVVAIDMENTLQLAGNKGVDVLQIQFNGDSLTPGTYPLGFGPSGKGPSVIMQLIQIPRPYNVIVSGQVDVLTFRQGVIAGRFEAVLGTQLGSGEARIINGKFYYEDVFIYR